MKLDLAITSKDIRKLQAFVSANQNHEIVVKRIRSNIDGAVNLHSDEDIWLKMTMCQLTSQQRSSAASPVNKFLRARPFRLSLQACSSSKSVEKFIQNELSKFGGIRFPSKIAKQMSYNLSLLNDGGLENLQSYLYSLSKQREEKPKSDHYRLEREASRYMQQTFSGFGPKQSRNFWQALGLTRYEFVLDSRVLKWLREMQFPLPLSSTALSGEDYYCFVSDILRDWCNQANVIPCVVDACIFSSFERKE